MAWAKSAQLELRHTLHAAHFFHHFHHPASLHFFHHALHLFELIEQAINFLNLDT